MAITRAALASPRARTRKLSRKLIRRAWRTRRSLSLDSAEHVELHTCQGLISCVTAWPILALLPARAAPSLCLGVRSGRCACQARCGHMRPRIWAAIGGRSARPRRSVDNSSTQHWRTRRRRPLRQAKRTRQSPRFCRGTCLTSTAPPRPCCLAHCIAAAWRRCLPQICIASSSSLRISSRPP